MPKTMFEKIWEAHEVRPPEQEGGASLIYVDLHLVHEVTSAQAFEGLRLAGRKVRRPDRTLATADHNVPTDPRERTALDLGQHRRRHPAALGEVTQRESHRLAQGLDAGAREGRLTGDGGHRWRRTLSRTFVCRYDPSRGKTL